MLKKHFEKDFIKRYTLKVWNITFEAIQTQLKYFDNLINSGKASIIKQSFDSKYLLVKVDFKIAGQIDKKWRWWNRYICFVDRSKCEVNILLIYSKNNIWDWNKKCSKRNETNWYLCLLEKKFPEFSNFF